MKQSEAARHTPRRRVAGALMRAFRFGVFALVLKPVLWLSNRLLRLLILGLRHAVAPLRRFWRELGAVIISGGVFGLAGASMGVAGGIFGFGFAVSGSLIFGSIATIVAILVIVTWRIARRTN